MRIARSFIPWVGGKSKLLWLIRKLAPPWYPRFIDVFGGSGTVTLSRPLKKGCILISREDITARQAITTITHLSEVIDSLILQLVDASNEIVDVLDIPDPLETMDEDLLDDLLECGANLDGLRLLLAVEDEADEE